MPAQLDAPTLWREIQARLESQLTRATFDRWLKSTEGLVLDEDILLVEVPDEPTKDWLSDRMDGTVGSLASELTGQSCACRFIVRQGGARTTSNGVAELFEQASLPDASHSGAPPVPASLNPRYLFDTFVAGSGNRLAHAAAQAVSEQPGQTYNPLFIHGGVGLGKTHLLHAIGNAALERGSSVLIVSSEKFTNDLISAIRTQSTEEFRSIYRAADMLLIDDIQFIAGKESTQEEFFHTFNAIHGSSGQIVLTSDRPPQSIATLEDRLRSRFQWGLLVGIEPPDLETRIAILQAKSQRQGRPVPDAVIELIAQTVQQNVRELEGALNRVVAYADIHGMPLNVDTANLALSDLMLRREPPALGAILRTVGDFYGVSEDELLGRGRTARISEPRQVAMFLMREETDASLPTIGREIGGRDHTTVLHGCDKIGRLVERDAQLRRDILQIRERLYAS